MHDVKAVDVDGIFEFDGLAKEMVASLAVDKPLDISDPVWLTAAHRAYMATIDALQKRHSKCTLEAVNHHLLDLLRDDQRADRERILAPLNENDAKLAIILAAGIVAWQMTKL